MTTATLDRLPAAQAWLHASHARDCPTCRSQIKTGGLVAQIATVFGGAHVCADCTSSPRPGETR